MRVQTRRYAPSPPLLGLLSLIPHPSSLISYLSSLSEAGRGLGPPGLHHRLLRLHDPSRFLADQALSAGAEGVLGLQLADLRRVLDGLVVLLQLAVEDA